MVPDVLSPDISGQGRKQRSRVEKKRNIAVNRQPETARLRNRRQIIAMPVGLKTASGRIRNKGRRRGPDKRTGSKRTTASCVGRVAPFRRLERLRVILQGWRTNGLHLSLDNVHLPSSHGFETSPFLSHSFGHHHLIASPSPSHPALFTFPLSPSLPTCQTSSTQRRHFLAFSLDRRQHPPSPPPPPPPPDAQPQKRRKWKEQSSITWPSRRDCRGPRTPTSTRSRHPSRPGWSPLAASCLRQRLPSIPARPSGLAD